ncbi:hypothetical protein HW555_000017 [Spodoptera exigua]|uniref:Uncharacterized protein n=1 Tax=Spodoptera exigua TaxID=7107 RepID=A0A835GTM2_SPOEX|nr:hypothetical protein HW555_000017 [Spodoptera exigua]
MNAKEDKIDLSTLTAEQGYALYTNVYLSRYGERGRDLAFSLALSKVLSRGGCGVEAGWYLSCTCAVCEPRSAWWWCRRSMSAA